MTANDVPMTEKSGPCRHCYFWKRQWLQTGCCWHPTNAGAAVDEQGTCEHFTPKVILISRPTPQEIGR